MIGRAGELPSRAERIAGASVAFMAMVGVVVREDDMLADIAPIAVGGFEMIDMIDTQGADTSAWAGWFAARFAQWAVPISHHFPPIRRNGALFGHS
jgi:hypothetical protein